MNIVKFQTLVKSELQGKRKDKIRSFIYGLVNDEAPMVKAVRAQCFDETPFNFLNCKN